MNDKQLGDILDEKNLFKTDFSKIFMMKGSKIKNLGKISAI